ncbi:MAG TPA: PilX N-terminal domain-containing pilus assembly protein [Steroidobacteraceae bacterium]|jgi:type IV pilus assembly protein PilX
MSRIHPTAVGPQRGMALISALLLLLVVTIMAISMFRSYGMQEKIAGNTREKQRALNSAVSAQQYAEWLLQSGVAPATAACNALVPATTPQVCNNPLNTLGPGGIGDYTILPWGVGVIFTPFTTNNGNVDGLLNTVSTSPSTSGSGLLKQESYYQTPNFYIQDLGALATGNGEVYQVDAVGYGGTSNAVAVVESTYLITSNNPVDPTK